MILILLAGFVPELFSTRSNTITNQWWLIKSNQRLKLEYDCWFSLIDWKIYSFTCNFENRLLWLLPIKAEPILNTINIASHQVHCTCQGTSKTNAITTFFWTAKIQHPRESKDFVLPMKYECINAICLTLCLANCKA